MTWRKSLILILICVSGQEMTLLAQVISPSFRNYTTEDGLPSSEVYVVLQDRKGNMWFGTDRGVARFNGYEFRSFSFKDGLTDNTVFKMFEDEKGRLWILTYSGKIFYLENEKIISYKYNDLLLEANNTRLPTGIFVDSLENVFVSLRNYGVFQISKEGIMKWRFKNENLNKINFLIDEVSPENILTSIIWPSVKTKEINILHSQNNLIDTMSFVSEYGDRFNALRLTKSELLISVGRSLYLKTNDQIRFLMKFPGTVYFLSKDKNNNIYAGTEKGAFLFDSKNLNKYSHHFLKESNVTGILKDHEGGYWFTTLDNGVYYMPGYGISGIKFNDGLIQKPISLTTDFKSNVYAGCWSGVLVKIRGGEINSVYRQDNDRFDQPVTNLTSFQHDEKIYLSRSGPAYFLNDKLHQYRTNILLGVKTNFLQRFDGLYCGGSAFIMKVKKDSIIHTAYISQRINCLGETQEGKLLVGCNRGVFIYDDVKKVVSLFHKDFNNIRVDDIKRDDDKLFFATKGKGLLIYYNDTIMKIDESDGLCSDLINKIFIKDRKIWCISNKGISFLKFNNNNPKDFSITNIRSSDGLLGDEINDITELNDTIYIATNAGVSFFNSNNDFKNHIHPPVYISSLRINSTDTAFVNGMKFGHDYNNLQIGFNAISFKSKEKIKYNYQLISGKDTLTSNTTNRVVEFLRLQPGNYSFTVIAMNNSGVWSQTPALFSFTIMPAWWQTWWFKLILILAAIAGMYLIYKVRIRKLKYNFEIERRQASLQLTAMRAQMNPHFIFNVMNSIRNYMQNHDMKSAEKYLTSFSKLVRYTLDNSEVQEVTLGEELKAIRNYVELEMQRFENGFEFNIQCEEGLDLNETMLLSMVLQPFVENAIKHGISRMSKGGKILIDVRKKNDSILIAVEDNGVGIEEASHWNEEHREKHVSHGTTINCERIQAYNKVYSRNIQIRIINLKDNDGKSAGTRVEVLI